MSQGEREHSIWMLVQDSCSIAGHRVVRNNVLEPALPAYNIWLLNFQEFSEPIDFMLVAWNQAGWSIYIMEIGKLIPALLRAYCWLFISILLVIEEADGLGYQVEKILQGLASPVKECNINLKRRLYSFQVLDLGSNPDFWQLCWTNSFISTRVASPIILTVC